ncbi:glycosyltransferase family 2 protein [Paenibacillus fonticola]|uniref:glycosyltransferase family 2 protein n=1 Tax=Paenibacillus fonticola TaxID=379896 RepID=UPI00037390CB|nr:glycosyltransferase family 2 protein [Paenibacillus fonticola]
MKPTVSVHIVTYNSADDIGECLNAVMQQTYRIQQVVIIDNASTDDTLERVQSFMEKSSGSDGLHCEITLIPNQDNSGFAPAHNQAIELTDTDYVLVLNPDVQLQSDYVERLIAYMQQHPNFGSATGLLLLKSGSDIVDSTGIVMNGIWRAFDRGAGESVQEWRRSGEVFGVSGAAALYARKMIEDISIQGEFFDADFFAYKEDVDVAWRARQLGWKAYYCAEAVGTHERGWKKGSRRQQPLFIRRMSYINRYKMIYKNLRGFGWLSQLPKLLAYELLTHGYILLREPQVLGAWKGFWQQKPALRLKRQAIQNKLGHKDQL